MKRLFLVLVVTVALIATMSVVAYAAPIDDSNSGYAIILPQDDTPPEEPPPTEEPSPIGEVVGTLGLYAAMMAVLAVGSEVIIDAVRPVFGLKRKTSSSEALKKLKEWLPSTLEELGVGSESFELIAQKIDELETVTGTFDDQVKGFLENYKKVLIKEVQALGVKGAKKLLDDKWVDWESELKQLTHQGQLLVNSAQLKQVKAWLEKGLESPYESISGMLNTVREQREQLDGILTPLNKVLRWFLKLMERWSQATGGTLHKVRKWVGVSVLWLEYAWLWLRDRVPGGFKFADWKDNLGQKVQQAEMGLRETFDEILSEDVAQRSRETRRITWLRIISVVVGIFLAATLSIDSLELLKPVLGQAAERFYDPAPIDTDPDDWHSLAQIISGDPDQPFTAFGNRSGLWRWLGKLVDWLLRLPPVDGLLNLTPGVILSGLGAAAGSAFWHDQLDKLRQVKQTTAPIEGLVRQLKQ